MTRVLIFRPTMADGGADRVTLTLLQRIDRRHFAPTLALVRREGVLLGDVPADVPVRSLDAPRLARAVPGLVRLLRAERPDVVLSTCTVSNIVVSAAHRIARSQARLVLSERAAMDRVDRSPLRRRGELALKRITYPRADLVTAVSRGVARQLRERLALPDDKIRVIYHPVVDDDLAARARDEVGHPWFAGETPVLVAAGRLVAIKDYPTLLRAFARIRQSRPARLVILGTGPLRAQLEAEVTALGLGADVAFAGYDSNPLKYMARAAALLHASRSESLGGALIEAMACGTPVVATDCDVGPREIILASGDDGFLVPVGDDAAMAGAALRLLADRALRDRIGASARRSAQRFSVAESIRGYEQAIQG